MKKGLIWIIALILIVSSAHALELQILDINMQEEQIFSPGEPIVFKAYSEEDADTAMLIIIQKDNPILTKRMKLFSEFPKMFGYLYETPEDFEQGDYVAKVISKGESDEKEFYIGIEIHTELMKREEIQNKDGFFEKLLNWIKSLFGIENE